MDYNLNDIKKIIGGMKEGSKKIIKYNNGSMKVIEENKKNGKIMTKYINKDNFINKIKYKNYDGSSRTISNDINGKKTIINIDKYGNRTKKIFKL